MDDKEYENAIKMIDKIYRDLYKSDIVIHRVNNIYDKYDNIKSYIDRLERIHKKAKDNPYFIDKLKKYYYDKYVIKVEDIPDSFYIHQQKLALERGEGHLEITDNLKLRYQEQIINNQKKSLDIWLDYFFNEDSNYMPMWAKFWAFQGMLKLGTFDKEKGKFNKRTKNNTGIFVDLNREALAISFDYMRKILNKEKIEDNDLEKLLKSGSFGKIYEYVLNNLLKKNKNNPKNNEGIWIKYDKGSDHIPLVKSLQGYNTGWCIAGESTASNYLSQGDFYIFYTKNENNEYKIPRIAIRMDGNFIAEIRGIAIDQNIESSMVDVVEEKIKDFPDKDLYQQKIKDMEYLTYIYKLNKNGKELSLDDLKFLYETDRKILGFGYKEDPRIEEIKKSRNPYKDYALIYNCKENEIGLNYYDLNERPNEIKYYLSTINTAELYSPNAIFPNLKYIKDNLCINDATFFEKNFDSLECVGRCIEVLFESKECLFPSLKNVGGEFIYSYLKSSKGFENLENVGRGMYFPNLLSDEGFKSLKSAGKKEYGMTNNFESLQDISELQHVKFLGNHLSTFIFNEDIASKLVNLNLPGKIKLKKKPLSNIDKIKITVINILEKFKKKFKLKKSSLDNVSENSKKR